MRVGYLLAAATMFAAGSAIAQAPNSAAAQNGNTWDALQKLYPPRALAAHEEGAVGFKVTLDSKGAVTNCEVTRSSGHPLLDQETCDLVTLHAVFNPDAGVTGSRVATHDGLIAWKLPASSPTMAAPQAIAGANAPDKVICKKTVRTGTLASFERTCMSQSEWAKQRDASVQPWDELQGRKGSTSGN